MNLFYLHFIRIIDNSGGFRGQVGFTLLRSFGPKLVLCFFAGGGVREFANFHSGLYFFREICQYNTYHEKYLYTVSGFCLQEKEPIEICFRYIFHKNDHDNNDKKTKN